MSKCEEHRVDETHARSIAKGVTGRLIEIAVDTAILVLLGINPFESVGVAVALEGLCFATCYFNERLWNKVSWGRRVIKRLIN
jgi:uncharacterized membrane protein